MNTVIDLTPIAEAIITILFALIAGYLVPCIRTENARRWVRIFVMAAEQALKSKTGVEKKAYVIQELQKKGFKLSMDSIDALIESEVLKLNKGNEED